MPDWEFSNLKDDGRVGKVTSAACTPRQRKNIGYAWLPLELAEIGIEVDVDTPYAKTTAKVAPMPFFDPGKEIPKSESLASDHRYRSKVTLPPTTVMVTPIVNRSSGGTSRGSSSSTVKSAKRPTVNAPSLSSSKAA